MFSLCRWHRGAGCWFRVMACGVLQVGLRIVCRGMGGCKVQLAKQKGAREPEGVIWVGHPVGASEAAWAAGWAALVRGDPMDLATVQGLASGPDAAAVGAQDLEGSDALWALSTSHGLVVEEPLELGHVMFSEGA